MERPVGDPGPEPRRWRIVAAAFVAVVAFLPFLRGALAGASLYFRDLGQYFFPVRIYALDGLRSGEVRLWNPLVHGGVPLSLPAVGYPLDLLQALRPDEVGISLLLALHVPLAALAFLAMARGLGLPVLAAAGGALVYSLGGFLLSTVNLYVYVQAAAWAPLLVLGLAGADPVPGRRRLAAVALALAVGLSTTGVEIVAQAILAGLVLGLPGVTRRDAARRIGRFAVAGAIGLAMAAPVLVLMALQLEGSARGRGLSADVVLAHSVHPLTLLQVLVGGLYGNLGNLANEWWGQNFFPRGFPYVVSLYLGAAVLALAAVGAASGRRLARTLAALAAIALIVSLGRWAGLTPVVEGLPALRVVRFPVKAFFTVHLAVALLASIGLASLEGDHAGRHWRRLAGSAFAAGSVLVFALALPSVLPVPLTSFAARFFPPGLAPAVGRVLLGRVIVDSALGGLAALALGGTALMVVRGHLRASRAAWLAVAIVVADLLRTGAGLNPMVSPAFFRPSPELAAWLPRLRETRTFTCSVEESPAYHAARTARGADHELWSFLSLAETLTPPANMRFGVATAMSTDVTMLVPEERVLTPGEASCRDLERILPRLRSAGVGRVLSTIPLASPDLELEGTLRSSRMAPLAVWVYAVAQPKPWMGTDAPASVAEVRRTAGWIEAAVAAEGPVTLSVLEGWAPGWTASVDGGPTPVRRAAGATLAVSLPAGRSLVVLRFAPRLLGPALALAGLGLAATLVLGCGRRPSRGLVASLGAGCVIWGSVPASADAPNDVRSRDAARRVIDIPLAVYHHAGAPVTRPLRRLHDLLGATGAGGSLVRGAVGRTRLHPVVTVEQLPWAAAPGVHLVNRTLDATRSESVRALVLWEGDEWCSPLMDLPRAARLRLEVGTIGPVAAVLQVSVSTAGRMASRTAVGAGDPASPTLPTADVPLPPGQSGLCLGAERGPVFVGEPRILAPEADGEDRRPRWIVLTILDATRADLLEREDAPQIFPALVSLARRGHRYEEAVSTGAHTQAGVLPLLMGRDLARIDPLRAGRFTPQGTPLALLYSRANLAVSHLGEAAGYHSVFLGNNRFLRNSPLFQRSSHRGAAETATVETIEALPGLLERYADERVLLVYHVASAHGYSFTPRRLYQELDCTRLAAPEATRCAYVARAAHADEALAALLRGLSLAGLEVRTFHVVTADHGELLGDGRSLDVRLYDRWWGLDAGHGASTSWKEIHVPLVVAGPGLGPAVWRGRVSTLDVLPTLAAVGSFPVPQRLDGRLLPLMGGPQEPVARLVSHGYCTHSVLEGRRQLVLWEAECAVRREQGTSREVTHRSELWEGDALVATDETDPDRVASLVRRHLEWLSARQPAEAWTLDAARLGSGVLKAFVEGGRIVDWGPSGTLGPFPIVSSSLGESERELRLTLDGRPGLLFVATWPPEADTRFEMDGRRVDEVRRLPFRPSPAPASHSGGETEALLRRWMLIH